jgi:hypothetical protein
MNAMLSGRLGAYTCFGGILSNHESGQLGSKQGRVWGPLYSYTPAPSPHLPCQNRSFSFFKARRVPGSLWTSRELVAHPRLLDTPTKHPIPQPNSAPGSCVWLELFSICDMMT